MKNMKGSNILDIFTLGKNIQISLIYFYFYAVLPEPDLKYRTKSMVKNTLEIIDTAVAQP